MPHSPVSRQHAHTLACPACNQDFEARIWLVIDPAEQPELVDAIHDDTLQGCTCPACGAEMMADAPLLVVRPDHRTPLLFSPADNTDPKQDWEQAAALLDMVQSIPDGPWQEGWEELDIPSVPRPVLGLALEKGVEEAQKQVMEQSGELATDVGAALMDFIRAGSWQAAWDQLKTEPLLLEDEAFSLLTQLLEQARATGHEPTVRVLEDHLAVLRSCREEGVEATFAKLEAGSRNIPSWAEERLQEARHANRRFLETGDTEALQQATEAWDAILASDPFETAPAWFRAASLHEVGGVQLHRYRTGIDPAGLDRCLHCWRESLDHTPDGSPDRCARLSNLGTALIARFHRTEEDADLEEAIRLFRQSVAATEAPEDRASALTNLGIGLVEGYRKRGGAASLDAAIGSLTEAVDIMPENHPDRADTMSNLGSALADRYERTGDIEDLEHAVDWLRKTVGNTPADSPDRATHVSNLAHAVAREYEATGEVQHLNDAADLHREAVINTPKGTPERRARLDDLALAHATRFRHTGHSDDLPDAIQAHEEALKLTPEGSPERPGRLIGLALTLHLRYEHTGSPTHLDASIARFREAADLLPEPTPERLGTLTNLANMLRERFLTHGEAKDLEETIALQREVMQHTNPDAPDRPRQLNNLGVCFQERFDLTRDPNDLEQAITLLRQATRQSPQSPPFLDSLASALLARHRHKANPEDLDEAIDHYQKALHHTPEDTPERGEYEEGLAEARRFREGG